MKKRIISAIFILLILFAFLLLRFVEISIFDIMTFGISVIAGYEISTCNKQCEKDNYLTVVIFFSVITFFTMVIASISCFDIIEILGVLLCDFILSLVYMFILSFITNKKEKIQYTEKKHDNGSDFPKYVKKKYITTTKIMIYPVVLLSSLYFVNNFSRISSIDYSVDFGLFLITSIFSVSMATDTFAFFVGKLLKGPHLAPKISPNKTISGAIGGLFFGILALVALYGIFNSINIYKNTFIECNITIYHIIFIGALTSIVNQLGDLYESYEKRRLGIKDFGHIIPGHGGIMDRVDGMSFVSLATFIIYAIMLG